MPGLKNLDQFPDPFLNFGVFSRIFRFVFGRNRIFLHVRLGQGGRAVERLAAG